MPDLMDAVQQYAENHTADALAQHARRSVVQGRTQCANADCGEPIAPERTSLGAQLCLDCQHEEEARAAHFAKWGHR